MLKRPKRSSKTRAQKSNSSNCLCLRRLEVLEKGFQPFVFIHTVQERIEKRIKQSAFQYFLNFDNRKNLGSGGVQCVTVRHGW